MRILATADLHIGAGTDHRVDALADQRRTLVQIVTAACEREADLVLIAGDVFHRPKPTPAELHAFAMFTRALAAAEIPAIACLGNAGHDQLGTDLPTALELFESRLFRVSRRPELITEFAGVAVASLPSVPVARLVAAQGGGDRAETNELAATLLMDVARELRAEVANVGADGLPSILMGHWSVSGASLPNGLPVADLHEPVLPLDAVEALGFDAAVFGHIHRGQLFASNPANPEIPILYAGSPMVMDFGEASFEHGVWIMEVDQFTAIPEFVPLADRTFVTVNVDLSDTTGVTLQEAALDETDLLVAAIAEHFPLEGAVLRVSYTATEEQHRRIDHQEVKALIEECGVHKLYGGLQWLPVRETRARVAGVDEQLEPLAAVDAWCGANDVDDESYLALGSLTRGYLEAAA